MDSISKIIQEEEWRNPDLLTSLHQGSTLLIASDYGGDHAKAAFKSLSFLVADLEGCAVWEELRLGVRLKLLKDSRRMAYKNLKDRRRSDALIPFLRAADNIPGLLATFLFDRRVQSIFGPDSKDAEVDKDSHLSPESWTPRAFERLCRVSHLGSLLVSGLSVAGQNVIWLTDEDEIAPNKTQHFRATQLIAHHMSHYCVHPMGHFRFGTTRSDTGKLDIEDLVSVADLAAGATSEVATALFEEGRFPEGKLLIPPAKATATKALKIAGWLAEDHWPLRRLVFVVEFVPPDKFKSKLLRLFCAD